MSYLEIRVPQKFTNPDGLIVVPRLDEGLVAEWSADTLDGVDGAEVTTWSSSGERSLIADQRVGNGTYPTLEANTINGHHAVAFNGSQGIRAVGDIVPEGGDVTIAATFRTDHQSVGYILDTDQADGSGRSVFILTDGHIFRSLASTGSARLSSGVAPRVGQWVSFVARFSGTTGRLIGTPMSSEVVAADIPPVSMADICFGTEYRGYSRFTGAIASVMIYDRHLSDVEASALLDVMSTRYGIPRV